MEVGVAYSMGLEPLFLKPGVVTVGKHKRGEGGVGRRQKEKEGKFF